MTRIGRLIGAALLTTLFLGPWTTAHGQGDCLNNTLYPAGAITPDNLGAVTTISTISYEVEYSQITGILAGASYEFTLASGGYITVRQGTFDGPVIGQGGGGSVIVTTTSTEDLFPHWNTNSACGTASIGFLTTVQLFLDCTPPTVSVGYTEDCDLGAYYIDLDITSTGDAATVDVIVDIQGSPTTTEDVGVGVLQLGPFFPGDDPNVTVAHESDPLCNRVLGLLAPISACPIDVFCNGPLLDQTYCYGNNDQMLWVYEGQGTGTMRIRFHSGTIQGAFADSLKIYDGQDASGTLLYEHLGTGTVNLAGIEVFGTSGFMFMKIRTNGTTSCQDGGFGITEWVWDVGCGDCTLPAGTATFVTDCPTETFVVNVDITSLGDASTATINYIVNGGDVQQLANLGLGITEVGPFPHGDDVSIVLQHGTNAFCEIDLGTFSDPGDCPNLINCGAAAEILEYCYVANDAQDWLYESVGSGTMRLRFLRGTIESNTYDDLRIYDGADNTAPLLFEHSNTTAYNLGPAGSAVVSAVNLFYGVEVFASGSNLYMEMTSDGSVQCSGSTTYDSWEWEVVCLDCTLPVVSYEIVDDCENGQFSIPVTVTSTGDGSIVNIVYTVNGGDPQTVVDIGVGTADLGPFAIDDTVNVTVEHESNFLCNREFGNLTDTGTCPDLVECGTELSDVLCYGNNADRRYYYRGTGTFPLAMFFDAGNIPAGDLINIYDGGDITAPVLYSGNNGGNAAGIFVSSTNPDHRLTLQVTSNGFTSCADATPQVPLEWRVACLDCVPATVEFSYVQDCANFQYFIDVAISDLGTDAEAGIINTATQDTVYVTEPGTVQIGPYVSGTVVEVTVLNDANSLCNVYSGPIVNPLCPAPIDCPGDALIETYCYVANDSRAWAYELQGGTGTLRLTFNIGTIESNTFDDLTIYDGPDNTSPVLFVHDQAARRHFGPEGSATNDATAVYYAVDVAATGGNLYMEMSSDGSVQCGSTGYDEWEWEVYCINCTSPQATINVIPDCRSRSYTAEVIVTEVGGDAGLTIMNTLQGDTIVDAGVGVYTFGPYALDSLSYFQVTNQDYVQCRMVSDTLTYAADSCIFVSCGSDNYDHCYGNDEDRWYTYQAEGDFPITIGFLQGQMLSGDRIVLYNGRNESSNVLYQGNNGGNLAGFALNSQNAERIITLRIQSNGAGSCDDGQVLNELRWSVQCGAVGLTELAADGFAVYPNPTSDILQIELGAKVSGSVQCRVLDMSGRVVIERSLQMNGGTRNVLDMGDLQSGQYLVQLTTANWVRTERVQVAR